MRSTPACRNKVSTATSGAAAAAVCEVPARRPPTERPLLTAKIGFRVDNARASQVKRRGFPNDST